MNGLIGALARLDQARAYAALGDSAAARAAYGGFLADWKHADPEVPVLKEARIEYERLPR